MNPTDVRFNALCIARAFCQRILGWGKATSFITTMIQYHYMPKRPDCRCEAFLPLKDIDRPIRQAAALHLAHSLSPENYNEVPAQGD
jgi:hypothetical protein